MSDEIYTEKQFILEITENKSNVENPPKQKDETTKSYLNRMFHNNIIFIIYTSSDKKQKPAIVCSYDPLIRFFLTGIGFKKSKIDKLLDNKRKMENELKNDPKHISTFSFLTRKPQTLPTHGLKKSENKEPVVISPYNIEEIYATFKGISNVWKVDNKLTRKFS